MPTVVGAKDSVVSATKKENSSRKKKKKPCLNLAAYAKSLHDSDLV